MPDPTDAELLSLVKAAMSGTLSRQAQSSTIAGRSITSFSLKELMGYRDYLEKKIADAAGTSKAAVVEFRSPA